MNKSLPIYEITFDEELFESGINFIAVTDNPAIEVMSLRFSVDEFIKMVFSDEQKRIIAGPAIIPNKPIYRRSGNQEFYVVFTPETIEKMVEKFNSETRELKFNLEHDDEKPIKGFIKGSWIIEDPNKDKAAYYGFSELPAGTWFIEAKINDDIVWNDVILNMERVGFSIEGLMGVVGMNFSACPDCSNTQCICNDKTKNKENSMKKSIKLNTKFSKVKKKFNLKTKKFEEVITEDDVVLEVDELVVGESVTIEGETAPEDGTYVLPEEEVAIVVEAGEIVDIIAEESTKEANEEVEASAEEDKEEMAEEIGTEPVEDATAELIAKLVELESRLDAIEAKIKPEEVQEFKNTLTMADAIFAFKNKK